MSKDWTEVTFIHDVRAGGAIHERILVCGNETSGKQRGPGFQLWDRDGTFVVGVFALNPDFTQVSCDAFDADGDGVVDIVIRGNETSGKNRGQGIQVWTQDGAFVKGVFTVNSNTTDVSVESD